MKLVVVGVLVSLGVAAGTARADVPISSEAAVRDYVVVPTLHPAEPGTAAISSHVLFLNNCKTANCTFTPGNDDSRTNHTRLANHVQTFTALPYSDATWNSIVSCVKATYAPFDIQIVTTEPASTTDYFEVVVAGTCSSLDTTCPSGVVGRAPFNCGVIDDGLSFAFGGDSYYSQDTVNRLCWTIAQESAHVFGLDHEYLSSDPMTYLDGVEPKRFQNKAAQCGTNSPAQCYCGGSTQNSVAMLTSILGSSAPTPPIVKILDPANGATVTAGFPLHATATDDGTIDRVELRIDNKLIQTLSTLPFAFNAPADLGIGSHHVEVRAYDAQMTPGSAFIDVVEGKPCVAEADCGGGGKVCVDGRCVAGPSDPGGLGTMCTKPADCVSGQCNGAGGAMYCTEVCDPTMTGCPSGFECNPTTQANVGVCWPGGNDNGGGTTAGCNADGGSTGALPIGLGLAFTAFALRRRRRK
jgi:hypothetical protein